jgi:hypothetical protein
MFLLGVKPMKRAFNDIVHQALRGEQAEMAAPSGSLHGGAPS